MFGYLVLVFENIDCNFVVYLLKFKWIIFIVIMIVCYVEKMIVMWLLIIRVISGIVLIIFL